MAYPKNANKIALGTVGALSTARRLDNNVRPLGVIRPGGMVRLGRLQTYVEIPRWGTGLKNGILPRERQINANEWIIYHGAQFTLATGRVTTKT